MEASTSSTIEPESMYGYINNLLMNPTALIILVIVVLIYIIVFVSLVKTYPLKAVTDD
jgi:hypothetical protein